MTKKILLSWVGVADLTAAGLMLNKLEKTTGDGPILGALKNLSFDELHLLHNQDISTVSGYIDWLTQFNNIYIWASSNSAKACKPSLARSSNKMACSYCPSRWRISKRLTNKVNVSDDNALNLFDSLSQKAFSGQL